MYLRNEYGVWTILYTFIVYLHLIDYVGGTETEQDKLEFWNPKTEVAYMIDGRRNELQTNKNRLDSNEKPGHHNKPNAKVAEFGTFAQRHHTTKDRHIVRHRTNGTFKESLRTDHRKVVDSNERQKKALRTPDSKADAPRYHKEPRPVRVEREGRWPREDKHKKINIKSTRITPAYLMQQDAEETTKMTTAPDLNHTPNDLSPYTITHDIQDYITRFPYVNVTKEVIGRTVEYNDILLLKMTELKGDRYFRADSSKYMDEVPEKKIIFIVHGLSVMGMRFLQCLYKSKHFEKLLQYYMSQLDKFDIFLIPMANPDGFMHSYLTWNKNLSPQSACPGVALDRNFDIAWNLTREVSSCSQMYPGTTPFSEAESKAVRDTFHRYSHKIVGYLHVHSGTHDTDTFKGDAVLFPKGYTDIQSDDDKYIDLKGEIDEAMKNASFQVMSVTVDTLYNWYGKVSGSSVDYAATVYGIPYAMELVMQLYSDPSDYYALTEIWGRLIEVIFNNIWQNTHGDTNTNS